MDSSRQFGIRKLSLPDFKLFYCDAIVTFKRLSIVHVIISLINQVINCPWIFAIPEFCYAVLERTG